MFTFKKFQIKQDRCAMKVGTDGVLLGAWCSAPSAHRILDIGTGTGLIALMAAQRSPFAVVDAIEIDPGAAAQAAENVASSPFSERVRVHSIDLQSYARNCQVRYDLIVCNPPYFVNSLKNPSHQRTLARHNDTLPFENLLSDAAALLTEDGALEVILPTQEGEQLVALAADHGLIMTLKTKVYPTPHSSVKRLLLQFKRSKSLVVETELIVELERHCYSEAFKTLTKEFYLKH